MKSFAVKTNRKNEFIDITSHVRKSIADLSVQNGIALIYTPHTTAGITINENADPDVQRDMLTALQSLKFDALSFHHAEGNSPSHIKSTLVGCSEQIIIHDGQLVLGTWQGIYFCEFDGPRNRKVFVTTAGS